VTNPAPNLSNFGKQPSKSDETQDLKASFASISELEPLSTAVLSAWPMERWRDCGVVVGCSGGADSVALAITLCALRVDVREKSASQGTLRLVHVNHGLRGEASDGDEQFVRELAVRLGLEFHVERLSGRAGDEATLRTARESIFSEHAHAIGARYVAVGHTADDNAETMLHHLFRGTGPAGIAGIAPFRPLGAEAVLVRPMLNVRRDMIRDVLKRNHIAWREDASNSDTHYSRNWIRHELLPLVESRYPNAVDRIANAVSLQREWRAYIERQALQWLDEHRLLSPEGEVWLRRNSTSDSVLIVEAIQHVWRQLHWSRMDMTMTHWNRLAQSIQSVRVERYTLPGSVDVSADEHVVRLQMT
jgi:tRNA(Ile)-lysidine synthase